MTACIILVDNTNVFVGGQQLSAQRRGITGTFHGHPAADHAWRLDYARLYACLAGGRDVTAALLVGGASASGEGVWQAGARQAGFEVIVHPVNRLHLEKEVDTEMVARGVELICGASAPATLVLASGDRDFVPLVDVAHRHGWHVELCAFSGSFNPNGELARGADTVRLLDDQLESVGYYQT